MGKRSSARRGSARTLLLVGLLVGALGIAAPASALLGITLPIPSGGNPTTTIDIKGSLKPGNTDDTPNSSLDLGALNPSVEGLLGLTNLTGGLTQTATTLTQLLQGLQTGATVAGPVVQAHATEAAGTAIENLTTRAQNTAAAAAALDPATATEEMGAILTDLQGQALGEVAGLLPLALTTGLQVVQNIVTPLCSLTAIPSSFLPGIGLDTTRTYIDVLPQIQQTDLATNQLLRDTYSQVYDGTLASVNNIPNVGPIAGALLTLLKYNWTSSYTPPGSSTPIVTETKALMNVPTPIDVDHDGLFDLCGTTSFALTGSGTSISGIKITQTLTKMPLAKPVLPVQITGGLLNVINFGYDTTESTVPIVYSAGTTLDMSSGGKLVTDSNFAVHRGTNLTIPPVILKDLNLTTGAMPTFPPLLTPAPKPIVTQLVCLTSCGTLAFKTRFENVPTATHTESPLAAAGVDFLYTGAQESDSVGYKFAISSIGFGTVIGADRPASGSDPARVFSAPTAATSCFSISAGTCAPNAVAGDNLSSGGTASSPTSIDADIVLSGTNAPDTCTGLGSLNYGSRVNDVTKFAASSKKGGTGIGSGHLTIDTGDRPIDGCFSVGATLALAGYAQLTMTPGFKALNRVVTYHQPSLQQPVPDAKSGTATCPASTTLMYNAILPANANLVPVFCPFPVNAGTVTITGSPTVDSTLTASLSGWGPGAPNAPTYAYQWFKCDADGSNCAAIPGATTSTYVLQYGAETPTPTEPTDYHHKFYVKVTGTNLDGTASAQSAQTPLVELPPPPLNQTLPTLGANRKVGLPLSLASVGTWNPGATSYVYQWQNCMDAAGLLCSDIAGANGTATNAAGVSYVLSSAEKGKYVRVNVKGKNHGGLSPEVSTATAYIPGDPFATTPPGIKNGPANAVGAAVATGDNLSATAGAWVDTNAPFTFQWQRCDGSGNNCVDIAGANTATYQLVAPDDVDKTIRVVVTGYGLNGTGTASSGTTGVVLFNDLSAKDVTQIPDGTVNATVGGAGTTTYVGGSFDTVGAPTGGSGLVSDTGPGNVVTGASATAGAANGGVNATVPDGAGGYFLGGSFTQVKGVQCPGLAHIDNNNQVDQNYCYPGLNGTVNSLGTVGTASTSKVLVVGGSFTLGGGSNLMFIDPATTPSPVFLAGGSPNGMVKAITTNTQNNNQIYIGGKFSKAGGTDAALLASATLTWSGTQLASAARNNWSAGTCIGTPTGGTSACTDANASVNTVAWLSSNFVAVGGRFNSNFRVVNNANPTNQATRNNALLVGDAGASPSLLGWNPNIGGGNQTVNAIAVQSANGFSSIPIYIGGDFTTINGVAIKNLGEFGVSILTLGGSASSGANNNSGPMTTWLPNPNGPVTSLAWGGAPGTSTLIVGGEFTAIDTRPNTSTPFTTLVRHRLAKINIASSTGSTLPVVDGTWDPNAGRTVRTVSRDTTTGKVTVGGDFLVLGGQTRNNLAEFDPNSGVTGWNPNANGPVNALARDGGTVYAGGSFSSVGGSARANLAAINGGAVTGWNPGANGAVNAIDTQGGVVYAGGAFSTLAGAPRANLGAVNGDGTSNGWTANTDGPVFAVKTTGSSVYAGGSFANVNGVARSNVAALDLVAGNVGTFHPDANGAVRAIVPSGGNVYLGGDFTQAGGANRNHVARVEDQFGSADAWNPDVDGNVNALFLVGAQLFVGGDFDNAGGQSRSNLANLDTGSDNALSFNAAPNGVVKALSRTAGGSIAVGGAFTIIAGQAAPALGFFGG